MLITTTINTPSYYSRHSSIDSPGFFMENYKNISLKFRPNGFGISEVADGISERSGEIPRGHFAYSVLCEVASGASDEQNRNYFRSH